MEPDIIPTRPKHRRNASSKSNILRALVSPNGRAAEKEASGTSSRQHGHTQTVPILPPDHPHAPKTKVLGERHGNTQASPSKPRPKRLATSNTSNELTTTKSPKKRAEGSDASPKKSKSSTNLAGMFSRMNRSSKDLSAGVPKDKENTTPPSSSHEPLHTPIWSQFATSQKQGSRPSTRDGQSPREIEDEIAKYTPQNYSPSKQRNFNGSYEQPQLRPTLGTRPQSMYVMGAEFVGAIGRRVSGDRISLTGRKSEDLDRRQSKEHTRRVSGEKMFEARRTNVERKASGSSAEQAPAKEKLNITKRGGRVMAAVAALQGKGKEQSDKAKAEPLLDPKAVNEAFEAVLESRNIPQPMRHKMRSLTIGVKADFVKQDQEASKVSGISPIDTATKDFAATPADQQSKDDKAGDEDSKSTKRSRTRSRTFTFSKGDKRGDGSPSKKQRSSSKARSASTPDANNVSPRTPTTPRSSMDMKRRSAGPSVPDDFITYLRQNQDPTKAEVGRLHKLRILLRNETVAWVDSFVSLGGMTEIVGLLHRIIGMEWREEHEDQLLHETLLCLKGLCTTERAMTELEKIADELFPALLAMLFDDEKKGPAEYTTRTVIITVLFNFLTAAKDSSADTLEQQARKLLTYLADPSKPEDSRPVDFVLDMRISRPYKLWCRELTHVTKEVFWIFLHHLNVVPQPKVKNEFSIEDSDFDTDAEERAKALAVTYTQRHFPGVRPPVPAAPYIGGVEWDATTYITAHLDLLNGLLVSVPTAAARNALRAELQASGFEKVLGATLRTCKEKFYSGVHDGLRSWVAAAAEDGWETRYVREGPTQEEQARGYSPKKSPKKKDAAPKIAAPKIEAADLKLNITSDTKADNDDGWLG